MTISDLTFTPERWAAFWRAFKAEPQQLAGIEEQDQAVEARVGHIAHCLRAGGRV